MKLNIPSTGIIACVCEGKSEATIMDILLDNNLLIINRKQLIDESVILRTSVDEFQKRYLSADYEQKIYIIIVRDSHTTNFNLKPVYMCQVKEIIKVITSPEIEMLIIAHKNKYHEYSKSGKKPSIYCKSDLKLKNVKSPDFLKEYFNDPSDLVQSIRKYNSLQKQKHNEASLYDLLKK